MNKQFKIFFLILIIIVFCALVYFGWQFYLLNKENFNLKEELLKVKNQFSQTKKDLEAEIENLSQQLEKTKAERDDFELKYNLEKERMDSLAFQVSQVEEAVSLLKKLSETDPELLKKYSKVYFLNENYIPESFVKILPEYTLDPKKDYLIHSKVWPFLDMLMKAAIEDNIDIKIASAYRSFYEQADIKYYYKMTYGYGANKFVADQGYSEHQLGTTVDFTTSKTAAGFLGFEKTPAFEWLKNNAYQFGFILSYPEGNKYYQFEPWHWRFVGKKLSEKLHLENKNFYDLDQREIDQYLILLFDF